MKHIFRYRLSAVCFYFGMIIAFLALYYGNRSRMRLENAIMEKRGNLYRNEIQASYYETDFSMDTFPKGREGNCTIIDIYLLFDDVQLIHGVYIVAYYNEKLHFPLESGAWPTEQELSSGKPVVVIGCGYKDYVYQSDGREYFDIQGEAYEVKGYIGGGRSNEYDEYVIMFGGNLGSMAEEQLSAACEAWGLEIMFQSDSAGMEPEVQEAEQVLGEKGDFFVVSRESNTNVYVNADSDGTFFWIYAYCGGISVLVSVFWIMQRKKELIIRKAYGYSNRRLIRFLACELIKICMMSVLTAFGVILLINGISGSFMNYISDEMLLMLKTILLYMAGTIIVSMIYPVFCVLAKFPGADMNKREI